MRNESKINKFVFNCFFFQNKNKRCESVRS